MADLLNNPKLAGQYASAPESFGGFGRYRVYAVHTRFDAVSWFVTDAETICPDTGMAEIIRQEPTKAAAMAGL